MVGTEVVRDVATLLRARGIAVMPIKGVLLQHWLYADPADRPMTDVDLLVQPEELAVARGVLEAAGYREHQRSSAGALVFETPWTLAVDLHPHLFEPTRYRMPTDEVMRRGRTDSTFFGVEVRLPSKLDVYAHLIGKFGSDHLDATADSRLDEIARMGRLVDARPSLVAAHLRDCGMRRVARYALGLSARRDDCVAPEVLRHLPPDPIGRLLAAAAVPTLANAGPVAPWAAVFAHLLNDTVPRGLCSGVRAWALRTLQEETGPVGQLTGSPLDVGAVHAVATASRGSR